ncbi:hypothetical protein Tco_0020082 [Tanacetum coccineum]
MTWIPIMNNPRLRLLQRRTGSRNLKNWLSDLAKPRKHSLTFNELMSTPIDFTAFAMNHLQFSNLTKADMVGPVYNLLKGTYKSYVEHEYNMEECYKVLNDQLDWNNPEGDRCPFDLSKPLPLVESGGRQIVPAHYFFNNDLEYLKGGSTDRKYTTSITKTKAAKYELKGIEDMVPTLWSPIKVTYVKHAALEEIEVRRAYQHLYKFMEGDFPRLHLNDIEDMLFLIVQNKLFNLNGDVIVDLAVALSMFTRRIVIQKRVEDLQLGVKSYQKKLNISKLRTRDEYLSRRAPYTTLSDPQGVIYKDKLNRKRLMCSDKLYKFSDVMPRRRWSILDKKRSYIMVKDIDRQLLERRLMMSLEKFVSRREYGNDLRLLQWTI